MALLLEIGGLHAGYGAQDVLHGIDLRVREAGIYGIIGANGAGKTTILRAVSGLIRRRGDVRFAGRAIGGLSTEQIARLGIGHVPEGRGTLSNFTVEENLRLGAHLSRSQADARRDLDRIFTYFPRLHERLRQPAGTLSGGEQQMLAVSRALMMRPRLLMLDEPSFGLAPIVIQTLFGVMADLRKSEGITILLVEQNVDLVLEIADECSVVETGRVALSGKSDDLRGDDSVRKRYLGY